MVTTMTTLIWNPNFTYVHTYVRNSSMQEHMYTCTSWILLHVMYVQYTQYTVRFMVLVLVIDMLPLVLSSQ